VRKVFAISHEAWATRRSGAGRGSITVRRLIWSTTGRDRFESVGALRAWVPPGDGDFHRGLGTEAGWVEANLRYRDSR
jgi:hypothetical protein